MVYYRDNKWHLSGVKVRFTDNNEETTRPVGSEGKNWWTELAKKHDDIEVLEFIDIESSEEEMARLEEVNQLNIGDGFSTIINNYVIHGRLPNAINHPLKDLQSKKENESLRMEQTMASMELGGAMQMLNMQNEVSQAEMLMEIGMLLEQLQGGK